MLLHSALAGVLGMQKLVNDILMTGKTKDELLEGIEQVLERCKEHNITLSDSKMQMGTELKFAGHIINWQGSRPDPDKVKAIEDFPVPEAITDVRSFIGLANQFTDYTPDLRHNIEPMKPLLQKKSLY